MLDDFISLLFPHLCYACGKALLKQEDCICLHCLYSLPQTNFHIEKDNPVEKLFWGKTTIRAATALFEFSKSGKVQHLIHSLKYKGKSEIGYVLGKHYGSMLIKAPSFAEVDIILPVPLHKKSLKKRGYNQSEFFARGIAEAMKKEMINDVLIRKEAQGSQTKKSRFTRWKNVEHVFAITPHSEKIKNKHLLLVDDVVTTGATLDACSNQLLRIPHTQVSVATLAAALLR
jgi:ComF family protein